MPADEVTVVVLCGGTSRRLGGGDKTREPLGGSTVLDHLLDGLPDWPVVCVGESRETVRPVAWTREDPPGGGPVAALAAALPLVAGDVVVALAGDMPFAGAAVRGLVAAVRAAPVLDAALAADGSGRAQPLLAAYRTAALLRCPPRAGRGRPDEAPAGHAALPHRRGRGTRGAGRRYTRGAGAGSSYSGGVKAITVPVPGDEDALALAEIPAPTLNLGEVLIKVAAAGVNRADLLPAAGAATDPPPGALPYPGLEVSGRIVGLGQG